MPENGEIYYGFFMEKDWDFDLHYDIILVITVTVQHLEAREDRLTVPEQRDSGMGKDVREDV